MTGTYLEEWVHKAEEDYAVATALLRRRRHSTPNAIRFHCQQCAEKYLKAFLVQHGETAPRIHDLLELHRLCLAIDAGFDVIGDLLDILNPFAVEFRYPGEEATMDEAKEAIQATKGVRRFVRGVLALADQ